MPLLQTNNIHIQKLYGKQRRTWALFLSKDLGLRLLSDPGQKSQVLVIQSNLCHSPADRPVCPVPLDQGLDFQVVFFLGTCRTIVPENTGMCWWTVNTRVMVQNGLTAVIRLRDTDHSHMLQPHMKIQGALWNWSLCLLLSSWWWLTAFYAWHQPLTSASFHCTHTTRLRSGKGKERRKKKAGCLSTVLSNRLHTRSSSFKQTVSQELHAVWFTGSSRTSSLIQ